MKKLTIIIITIASLTFIGCERSADATFVDSTVTGQAGSLAKMVAVDNNLFVINEQELLIYDISNSLSPVYQNKVDVGFGIETIFPFANHLFIGSVDGMYIYDITDPVNPFLTTEQQVEHITACDPVVANENYAYLTLNTLRTTCGNLVPTNVLMTYDISDINNVVEVNARNMEGPKGLAIDGDHLFVCDASSGIKVFDLSEDPSFPIQIGIIPDFTGNDIVLDNGLMMVVCDDGLRQFDYSDINNITAVSFISTNE